MRNLFFLLLLFGLLGCEVVSDVVQEAQWCLPSRGKTLAIAAQHPPSGATGIDPHSAVVVQLDTDKLMALSHFGINVVDSADARWHYVTGGGADGRLMAYPSVITAEGIPPERMRHETLMSATFDELANIRPEGRFSPNAKITVEVKANCYEPYTFSFITGDVYIEK